MSNVKPTPERAEHTRPNIECTSSNLAETQLALQQVVECQVLKREDISTPVAGLHADCT
jgi:hypothetical protein